MIEINDESMTLTVDDQVFASARFSRHAAASGDGVWIVSCHAARLCTGDQAITAMMTHSHLDGVRSWTYDGPAHPHHYRVRRGGGRRCRRDHLLSARLRTRQLPWRVGRHCAAAAVHRGWPHLGGIHGGTRRQPPEPARTTPGCLQPRRGHRGNARRQPGARPGPRRDRCPGQRMARGGAGRLVRAFSCCSSDPRTRPAPSAPPAPRRTCLYHWRARMRHRRLPCWNRRYERAAVRAAASGRSPAN